MRIRMDSAACLTSPFRSTPRAGDRSDLGCRGIPWEVMGVKVIRLVATHLAGDFPVLRQRLIHSRADSRQEFQGKRRPFSFRSCGQLCG